MVYKCYFCSHWNLRRGTPKGHTKEICPSKAKASLKSEPAKCRLQKCTSLEKVTRGKDDTYKTNEIASPALARENPTTNGPVTPLVPATDSPMTPLVSSSGSTLLEARRGKRNRSALKKPAGPENNSTPIDVEKTVSSNKRRRKSWTSLKEIAESTEYVSSRNITNLAIPLFI